MSKAFQSVREFEEIVAGYAGSKYAVAVDSCTNAIFLACTYLNVRDKEITIPKRTYVSVPCSIMHAGGKVRFEDKEWRDYCNKISEISLPDPALAYPC